MINFKVVWSLSEAMEPEVELEELEAEHSRERMRNFRLAIQERDWIRDELAKIDRRSA